MYRLESSYWWYVARRKLLSWGLKAAIRDAHPERILDVGCGTGLNQSVLKEFGAVTSLDSSPEALDFSRSRGVDNLICGSAEEMPFAPESFDVITALDVLEHVDNDNLALQQIARVLGRDGLLFITVPAYGFLWSEHDEALHHRRRYSAYELRNKLTAAGLEVERITYFITLLFFPILVIRIWQNLFKKSVEPKTSHVILPGWLNALLIGVLGCERFLLRFVNLPLGVSLVCWARKAASVPVMVRAERKEAEATASVR
jgi:SAM-dependent methyltransferase